MGKRCGVRMQASERAPHTPGTSLPPPVQLVLIFSHNQDGLDMAMNSALSLHALGIDHVFILVSDSVSVGTRTHRPRGARPWRKQPGLPPPTHAGRVH